ncbi:DUF1128 family protein [Sporolactobacillus sp. THM7-4]|nr:DUF1128 family protein [Sporolactobacillus sp. THM7-4]
MDLHVKNRKNIDHMISTIRQKLQIANRELLSSEDYPLSKYDQLYEIYELLNRQESVSTFQMAAILDELKTLRNASHD